MGFLSLLTPRDSTRTKIKTADGTDVIVLDVTTMIQPTFEVDVTQHPIETGANVSDHIKVKNIKIELEGYASETPITLENTLRGLATSAGSVIGSRIGGGLAGGIGAAVAGFGANLLIGSEDVGSQTKLALIKLLNSKKHFKIAAPSLALDSNDNFVLVSLSFPRDKSTGKGVKFKCTIQQIQFAESKTIDVSKLSSAVAKAAAEKKDQGAKATKTEESPRNISILKGGTEGIKKYFFRGNL